MPPNGAPPFNPADDTIYNFGLTPDEFAWRGDVCAQIRARRGLMSGLLFFDILLKLGGIDNAPSLYPPTNFRELESLLQAIRGASYDEMKRDCLIYYLLKQGCDGREEGYAREKVISPQYIALADAYWWLDSGINLDLALCKLSDARIVKDYTSKIMETLALHQDSGNLIRKFVRTCSPPLNELQDMERYLIATAENSLADAWSYQRRLPDRNPIRKQLIVKLLTWALSPKPKSQPLTQLLAVPFSKFEEAEVQAFAKQPPEGFSNTSITTLRDLVCVRLIQSCKYVAAVKFDRQYPSSGASARGTWGAEREHIVKEILSIMPASERAQLETELAALGADARVRNTTSSWANKPPPSSGSVAHLDLSGSWEDLGRRSSNAPNAPQGSISGKIINSRAPKSPLPNGTAAFASGPSPSRERANQPPTGQSFLPAVSAGPKISSAKQPFSPLSASTASRAPQAPSMLPKLTRATLGQAQTNGARTNGSPNGKLSNESGKTNAFMTRNAFFNPPPARSPSPESIAVDANESISITSIRNASGRRPAARLPTPPRDESDEQEDDSQPSLLSVKEPIRDETDAFQKNGDASADHDRLSSDNEDVGYSIFNPSASKSLSMKKTTKRLTPSSGEVSPQEQKTRRSTRSKSEVNRENGELESDPGSLRKKLKVTVPGGFNNDDEEREQTELPSPASASVSDKGDRGKARLSSASSTGMAAQTPARRSTRKRAASHIADEDEIDSHPFSIPGTLFTSDDEINAFASAASTSRKGKGKANEELDELAPLPSSQSIMSQAHSTRGRKRGPSPAPPRTPRRQTRSIRGESAEPDFDLGNGTRSVRRSSRLSDASVASPQKKSINTSVSGSRPKKSTRTSGAGATATGRGATKRR